MIFHTLKSVKVKTKRKCFCLETISVPFPPSAIFVQNKSVKLHVLEERSSWATKRRRLYGIGEVDPGDGTPNSKMIQWFGLACWCCPVQVPSLLDTDIYTKSKQWPPPLLSMAGDAVLVHILVHPINTSHCLVAVQPQPCLKLCCIIMLLSCQCTTVKPDLTSVAWSKFPHLDFSISFTYFSGQSSFLLAQIVSVQAMHGTSADLLRLGRFYVLQVA